MTLTTVQQEIGQPFPRFPDTVGDVMDFLKAKGYTDGRQDEYVTANLEPATQLTTPYTWRIQAWWGAGGSEGYYFHVSTIERQESGKYRALILGKVWTAERAIEITTALTRYLNLLTPAKEESC